MTIRAPLTLAILALAFFSTAALADDNACMGDAFSICGQFIPNRERVAECLFTHRSVVSMPCRTSLAHFRPRAESASY
jgi:hypothetical protein